MTFDEWVNREVGFGNFTYKELLKEDFCNMQVRDLLFELENAYEAGFKAANTETKGNKDK